MIVTLLVLNLIRHLLWRHQSCIIHPYCISEKQLYYSFCFWRNFLWWSSWRSSGSWKNEEIFYARIIFVSPLLSRVILISLSNMASCSLNPSEQNFIFQKPWNFIDWTFRSSNICLGWFFHFSMTKNGLERTSSNFANSKFENIYQLY